MLILNRKTDTHTDTESGIITHITSLMCLCMLAHLIYALSITVTILKLSHSATYAGRDLSVLNSSEPCKAVCVSRRALRFIISCQQIFAAVFIEYDTVTICVLAFVNLHHQ